MVRRAFLIPKGHDAVLAARVARLRVDVPRVLGAVQLLVELVVATVQQALEYGLLLGLVTTETSATTNAMNFPLDTAERLMSAAGAMR